MDKKFAAEEKARHQINNSVPILPFDQIKSYGPLIQEFGLIVRNHGKDSVHAKQFLISNPDFTASLQLVSILEHLRGALFNIQYPKTIETSPESIDGPAVVSI